MKREPNKVYTIEKENKMEQDLNDELGELIRKNEKSEMTIYILEKENEILKQNLAVAKQELEVVKQELATVHSENLFLQEKSKELEAILYSRSYKIIQRVKKIIGRH